MDIARHRAAISRSSLSTPFQFAIANELVDQSDTIFDYGCGRGDDIRILSALGYDASGWDPHYAADEAKRRAALVNVGFVLNVIEDPQERSRTLKEAWDLTERVLLVTVRTVGDMSEDPGRPFGDGHVTSSGTFQKFFGPTELVDDVSETLGEIPVPTLSGGVAIFRDQSARHDFVSRRFRRSWARQSTEVATLLYEANEEILQELEVFVREHGRAPREVEGDLHARLTESLGSTRRAVSILRKAHGSDEVDEWKRDVAEDLALFLALQRFRGRPRLSELSVALQYDIKALFGSYKAACEESDGLLFSLGNPLLLDAVCRDSQLGKLTGSALYVHRSCLPHLDLELRAYEGCARVLMGDVEGANIIKFHRRKPAVSYLSYPTFEKVGHPELRWSYYVDLRNILAKFTDYSTRENPPILHRKEQLILPDDPLRKRFERLTRKEERLGLLDNVGDLGTLRPWRTFLKCRGYEVRGHGVHEIH